MIIKNNDTLYDAIPWFLLVLAFGFILRIIFLGAPLQSDDTSYFIIASDLSEDAFKDATNQFAFRLGLILPLALLQKILGYSLAAYYTYSVGSSLLLLTMIFIISHILCGLQTAIFSSLIFACSFFGLYHATNVLPDIPNLVCLLACLMIFTYADDTKGRKRVVLVLLAAFFAFCSYLLRAPNLIFLLSIPVYELLTQRSIKRTILFLIFFMIFWIGEGFFYKFITGDFLLRLKMVPKGVTLWEVNMPQISILSYLFAPLRNLVNSTTGIITLSGGIIGSLIAIFHKNRGLIALLAGGLCIFFVYSYSVSSVSPLIRALPLKTRYIVAFTVVLTIATGYTISSISNLLRIIYNDKIALIAVTTIVVSIMSFQIVELPQRIKNSVFFKDNSYFIADQIFRSKESISKSQERVYAFPLQDFNMYPNFSKLNLKSFVLSESLKPDQYILYSRSFIRRRLQYLDFGKDKESIQKLTLLLLPQNPAWKYIINTEEIVLVQVKKFGSKQTVVLKSEEMLSLPWCCREQIIKTKKLNESFTFNIANHRKTFQCYTFDGNSNAAPQENSFIFDKLVPGNIYEFNIRYKLAKSMQSFELSLAQYNDLEKIDTILSHLPVTEGENDVSLYFATNSSYQKFRVFFEMLNQNAQNTLIIRNMSISLLSD